MDKEWENVLRECARKELEQEAMYTWLSKPIRKWTDEQKIEYMNCMSIQGVLLRILEIVENIRDEKLGDLK